KKRRARQAKSQQQQRSWFRRWRGADFLRNRQTSALQCLNLAQTRGTVQTGYVKHERVGTAVLACGDRDGRALETNKRQVSSAALLVVSEPAPGPPARTTGQVCVRRLSTAGIKIHRQGIQRTGCRRFTGIDGQSDQEASRTIRSTVCIGVDHAAGGEAVGFRSTGTAEANQR